MELFTTAAVSFATALSANAFKGANGPAQALDDIMALVGFEKLHYFAEKKRAQTEISIKDYKEKIGQEIIKIPEQLLQEPPLSIVGPAIEASKFHIEQEDIRTMFAKLIASSMDSSKNNITHSSYVEIIKQMTPLDAENLISIHKNNNSDLIVKYKMIVDTGGFVEKYQNTYLGNPKEKRQSIIAPSLTNIERLGLVSIDYNLHRTSESAYDDFLNTNVYRTLVREMNAFNSKTEQIKLSLSEEEANKLSTITAVEIQKGLINVTPFGINFCLTCL